MDSFNPSAHPVHSNTRCTAEKVAAAPALAVLLENTSQSLGLGRAERKDQENQILKFQYIITQIKF